MQQLTGSSLDRMSPRGPPDADSDEGNALLNGDEYDHENEQSDQEPAGLGKRKRGISAYVLTDHPLASVRSTD
jgi:hypothetical protein